jgi:hypothetical protein
MGLVTWRWAARVAALTGFSCMEFSIILIHMNKWLVVIVFILFSCGQATAPDSEFAVLEKEIDKKLEKVLPGRKEKEKKRLYYKAARKSLTDCGLFKYCPKDFISRLGRNWPAWLKEDTNRRLELLKEMRALLEGESKEKRQRSAKVLGEKLKKQLADYWDEKVSTASGNSQKIWSKKRLVAMGTFDTFWKEHSLHARREFFKYKLTWELQLKKNQYNEKASEIYIAGLRNYFGD